MAGLIDGITGLANSITNKIAPDKTEVIQSDNDLAKTQIQLNQAAITSGHARWIDWIGMTCAWGLIFQILFRPFLCTLLALAPLFGADPVQTATICSELPTIDLSTILSIVLPMLGITAHAIGTNLFVNKK